MVSKKENTLILLFDEDKAFRMFIGTLLKELGYQQILHLNSFVEETPNILKANFSVTVCLIGLNTDNQQQGSLNVARLLREGNSFVPIIFLSKIYSRELYSICRNLLPSAFLSKELSGFNLQIVLEQAFLHHAIYSNAIFEDGNHLPRFLSPYFFKSAEGFIAIPKESILYCRSHAKSTYIHTRKQAYDTHVSLQVLEAEFQGNFIRVHKSYLINLSHVEAISQNESNITIGQEKLPIGYTFRKFFFDRILLR